jgi:NAD(P)-dependent dehydrogenase (short-subunit alcohol dehydrogenase family)
MLQGKTIAITGATNGIGEVAALELARSGASVVIISRSPERCAATVKRIAAETGSTTVSYIAADLSTLEGMRSAASQFLASHDRLHVLLNNAGALYTTREVTADGYEKTFALNHLSYFVLTNLLLDTLKQTAAADGEARVINVSSGAHFSARGISFDDLQRKKSYNAFLVYSETKLMNILFTRELAHRLAGTGVTANALHPGFVRSGFGMNNRAWWIKLFDVLRAFAISPEEGAQTSIYLAASPEVKGISGKYFEKKKVVEVSRAAQDASAQERLWQVSEELTGLQTPVPV